MEKQRNSTGMFEQALDYRQNGYRLVILKPGRKIPAFKGWQATEYSDAELERLLRRADWNLGIITGDKLVVLDIDSDDPGKVEWVIEHCGDTPMQAKTPNGLHFYYGTDQEIEYGSTVRIAGEPYDLRWNGCFVVAPPSVSSHGIPYRWIEDIHPVWELPTMKHGPLRDLQAKARQNRMPKGSTQLPLPPSGVVRRIRPYIGRIQSVQGQNGSASLLRVCLLLIEHGCNLPEAMALLAEWNILCAVPPWNENELKRALANAFNRKLKCAGDGRRP